MTLKKINWIGYKELFQKMNNILKTFSSFMLIMIATFFMTPLFAQNNKDTATSNSSSTGNDTFNVLDYSRPGKYHQLLADLVGTWTYKGSSIIWVDSVTSKVTEEISGTVVRKPFANGRFFIVDATADNKTQMPIQDGKTKEVNFQSHEIEGYDNVKKKFVRTLIFNSIGSAISFFEGTYDLTTRTITYETEMELAPGMKTKLRIVYKFHDKDHYQYEMYNEQNGKYIKFHEFSFTRVKGK